MKNDRPERYLILTYDEYDSIISVLDSERARSHNENTAKLKYGLEKLRASYWEVQNTTDNDYHYAASLSGYPYWDKCGRAAAQYYAERVHTEKAYKAKCDPVIDMHRNKTIQIDNEYECRCSVLIEDYINGAVRT